MQWLEWVRWYVDFGSLHDGEVCDKKGKRRHVQVSIRCRGEE